MKRAMIIFSLLNASLSVYPQLIIQPLAWGNNTTVSGKKVLNFREAEYPDTATYFPYYIGEAVFAEGVNVSARISEYKSEFVPVDSLSGIAHINGLPTDYSFTFTVEDLNKLTFRLLPLKRNPADGTVERITEFTVNTLSISNQQWASSSVLKTGKWVKFKITGDGMYKLTYSQIANDLGLSNPANIRIFGYGAGMLSRNNADLRPSDLQEIPLSFQESSPGTFQNGDYVMFYAEGPVKWYYDSKSAMFLHQLHSFSDAAYYFATTDLGKGKTIGSISSSTETPDQTVTGFDEYSYHEEEMINLCEAGSRWCGETFDSKLSYSFSHNFPDIITGENGKLRVTYAWQAPGYTTLSYQVNGATLGNDNLSPVQSTECYYKMDTKTVEFSPTSTQVAVTLNYSKGSSSSAKAILDRYDINVRRSLAYNGGQMLFRDINSVDTGNISEFSLSNSSSSVLVWEVTDIANAGQVAGTLSGNNYRFTLPTDKLRKFIAFNQSSLLTPTFLGSSGPVGNQDLHGMDVPNLLVVCHPDFSIQAQRLVEHRLSQGLKVAMVYPQQIYNEFSSGSPDVQAIRDFARMLHDKNPAVFRYLLLFGDGSWDNRFVSTTGNPNYILTYQMDGYPYLSAGIPVTDDFYGCLGADETADSGFLDIGVGRIPASDNSQAGIAVDKIIHYDSPATMGSWRNQICFVADDKEDDHFTFLTDADETAKEAQKNTPELNATKIYLDAYKQYISSSGQTCPDAAMSLKNAVSSGMIMLNFTGHGGPDGISSESIFTREVVNTWNNKDRLFLMFTGSCKVTRFDYLSKLQSGDYAPYLTAGEYALFKENGGAVCLVSTNRDTYAGGNINLNNALVKNIVNRQTVDPDAYRLGDIYLRAKNIANSKGSSGEDENTKNFILLGDPSMQLAIPELNRVITDSIKSSNASADTIKALQEVTLYGHVTDENGLTDADASGTVSITIFDKPITWTTIDNHGYGLQSFATQEQAIIKGNASIQNGNFSFSFMTPKDINYKVGSGKISYYAQFGNEDMNGYDTAVKIGGMHDTLIDDSQGPLISLYMNDTTFRNGGITDINPTLLVLLSDPCGINATGAGIGHDITAILDHDPDNKFILNNYYETNLNSYQSGRIRYPLYNLSPGKHTLTVTVWDALNNSAREEIEFVVTSGEQLILQNFQNYPNPMSDYTNFVFDHNMPDEEMKVTIQIFDLSGTMVHSLTAITSSSGYTTNPLTWDGTTSGGAGSGNGVFIYRVIAEVPRKGLSAAGGGKLIIAR